ncbi:Nitrate/nitrite transporter NarK [Amycolatopsis xylanica]|uniref:Nitrate/nitrite transporter NarK n=1 Tax=Amycolatopsis xylanica TaxID=589385 RepID=A0A1H3PEK2_9PSEU|nr:MFS transporter [Amycolatopsis xylanica]SDY99526.1 Nitrate/nitrite transporter NarK [Amycolatopsis xylanica]
MYLSTIGRKDNPGGLSRRSLGAMSGNVLALGTVSLVTDISSEMVTAILPVYLVLGLHLSPAAYGLVDGLYTGATAFLRLIGGYVADRVRRRKAVAGFGYGLSAVAKLGLLAAGSSAAAIGVVLTADRTGKGLRTAPRDALITLSAPEDMLGRAFGVHRAMDSVGAFAGPLVAVGVLAAVGSSTGVGGFDAIFVTSFCIAAIGVLLLCLFVRDRRGPRPPAGTVSPRAVVALLRGPGVRRLLLAACVLGMTTIGDGFVYLLLQRKEDIATGWFPLLAVGTNLAYLLLAAPLGALADRVGRLPVMLCGYGLLATVYVLLLSPISGWPLFVFTLGCYGAFYAATDGILMALAGPLLPEALRTTGISIVQSGQALSYFVSSVLFGLAWQVWGAGTAITVAACTVGAAIVITFLLLAPRRKEVTA